MRRDVVYSGFHEMFDIAYKKEKARFPMPPHTHNAIEIFLNLSELPSVLMGTSVLSLQPDVLLLFPSYCIHQMTPAENSIYERYILTINTSWFESVLGEQGSREYGYFKDSEKPLMIPLTTKQKKEIVGKMEQLIQCGSKTTFFKMNCFFDVMSWIHQIVGTANEEVAEHIREQLTGTAKTVSEMVDYINSHLYENITIEDIAARFYLNHDYAARIFKKYVNTTIRSFITIQRITKAQQLLLEGESVAQIQVETGYGSYEHFFRTFKKVTGMTPKEYRENYASINSELRG